MIQNLDPTNLNRIETFKTVIATKYREIKPIVIRKIKILKVNRMTIMKKKMEAKVKF